MIVTNSAWQTDAEIERAAERYRRHGYKVAVQKVVDTRGTVQWLQLACTPLPQFA